MTAGGRGARGATGLDLTGLRCPLPVLRAARFIRDLAPGTEIEVRATDPVAELDFKHFCAQKGHAFLGVDVEDDVLTIRFRVGQ